MGLAKDLKTIKDAELDIELLGRANEKLCADNNVEIAKLVERIKKTEIIMEGELKKSGEDKLECKFDGYKGSIGFNKQPDKWIYKDEILMAWIISLPEKIKELYLKVTTTVNKGDLKKKIMIDNDDLFVNSKLIAETLNTDVTGGELFILEPGFEDSFGATGRRHKVEGIKIEPQDPKFKYTIKKIKK